MCDATLNSTPSQFAAAVLTQVCPQIRLDLGRWIHLLHQNNQDQNLQTQLIQ